MKIFIFKIEWKGKSAYLFYCFWQATASKNADFLGVREVVAAKRVGNLTKSQLKSISSLEGHIATHQTKLAEYIKNPMKFDNKGFLKNAPNDAVRQKVIQSRINHLQQEIQTFKNNIQKSLIGSSYES